MAKADVSAKLKVFVSYSRRDSSEFAEELVAGLELAGFSAFLDRQDIAAGEDWQVRLGGLIREADTVVFVVSPEAVKSERCAWEVETALVETKRVLPVIWKPVPDSDIPEELRRRQFVRFDTGFGIARPLGQLAEALRQDLDWIREHTRLGELAGRWDARGHPDSLLLRGDDLAAAYSWLENRSPSAPAITELMRTFVAASKESETRSFAKSIAAQRRMIRMQAVIVALLLAVIAGLVGWFNQSPIEAEWRWYTVTRPFKRANVRPFVLTSTAESGLKAKDSFRECATEQGKDYCPQMVVIPAGSFMMGSSPTEEGRFPDEGPQHNVSVLRSFVVSVFEITFDEWDVCAAYGDCSPNVSDADWGRGQQPAINVTWIDAQHYAEWLAKITGKPYRLLTEAEYEYAARGGTKTPYPWGDDIGKGNANCHGCGSQWDNRQTAPVGSFPANAVGLYDMVGNVWGWVEDCYHHTYDDAPTDGSAWTVGDCSRRVVRGGSWSTEPRTVRSANRDGATGDDRNHGLGFRVARTLAQ
jgi:formylglycine-generating enzyme required for sulfatase activity